MLEVVLKIDSVDILLFGQKVSPVIFWIEPL